jgi:hypothetical protein
MVTLGAKDPKEDLSPKYPLLMRSQNIYSLLRKEIHMNGQVGAVLVRAALYSFLAGVASGIIYVIVGLVQGMKVNGDALVGSLITGAISFVIALMFFSGFMLYFSRKKA